MPGRLVDEYPVGQPVEITFDGQTWQAGRVAAHDPPGVWVRLVDGSKWYVTHPRRIRRGS